jgi:hypothetical protein
MNMDDLQDREYTIEEAKATLRPDEQRLYDALCCPDIVVRAEVKWAKELNNFQRRKAKNRTPEMEARLDAAGKAVYPYSEAVHPEIVLHMWQQIMVLRCQLRDVLHEEHRATLARYLQRLEENTGSYFDCDPEKVEAAKKTLGVVL